MTAPTITEERAPATQSEHEEPKYAHMVRKDLIVDSMVMNTPLITLCNRLLVPSRDPGKYPACPKCMEVLNEMKNRG